LFVDVHEFKCMSRELWSGTMSHISGVKKSIFMMLSFISNFITLLSLCYLVFIKCVQLLCFYSWYGCWAKNAFIIGCWAVGNFCCLIPELKILRVLYHQSFWITLTVIFVYLLLELSVIKSQYVMLHFINKCIYSADGKKYNICKG